MTTTIEEIRSRLGLQDFDTFALKTRWRLANERFKHGSPSLDEVLHRQQGHSTRNILAALSRLEDPDFGNVLIVAHNRSMGKILVRKAGDWALQLGIDPRRIKGTTAGSPYMCGWDPEQVFVDHVVADGI